MRAGITTEGNRDGKEGHLRQGAQIPLDMLRGDKWMEPSMGQLNPTWDPGTSSRKEMDLWAAHIEMMAWTWVRKSYPRLGYACMWSRQRVWRG